MATLPQISCYCIRLRRAANTLTDFYDRILQPYGITVNQYSLLSALSRNEDIGTGKLAALVGLEKSTLVRTLHPLTKQGLVEDRATSGRGHKWHLTESGLARLGMARPEWEGAQEKVRTIFAERQDVIWNSLADLDTLDGSNG